MKHDDLISLLQSSQKVDELRSDRPFTWCGGCGNYAIFSAFQRAFVLQNKERAKSVLCFDIGCHGNGADKLNIPSVHGLHGRVLPLSAGLALADQKRSVFAFGGDGGTLHEGVQHFLSAIHHDFPIVFFLHDNHHFALTQGQKTHSHAQFPFADPLKLAISQNASFVAQTISANIDHMTQVFQQAMRHRGFAFVRIRQTCPTYFPEADNAFYLQRAVDVQSLTDYDKSSVTSAQQVLHWNEAECIPIGVLYQSERIHETTVSEKTLQKNFSKSADFFFSRI